MVKVTHKLFQDTVEMFRGYDVKSGKLLLGNGDWTRFDFTLRDLELAGYKVVPVKPMNMENK